MLKGDGDIRCHWLSGICKDGSVSVCVQVRCSVMLKMYKHYGYSMEQHSLSFYAIKLLSHNLCDDSLDHCDGNILTHPFRKPYVYSMLQLNPYLANVENRVS
jgi:hypothetical protein